MILRKINKADLPVRVAWMNDPRVFSSMNFLPPISLEGTEQWYERISSSNSRFDVTFVDNDNNILAFGGLTNIDYTRGIRKAEFYVFVDPNRQKQGIGSLSTALLCKYAFDILQLHKVYLYTNDTNIGAQHTYEKVGFKLEGRHREEKLRDQKYEDRLYYGLLSSELNSAILPKDSQDSNYMLIDTIKIGSDSVKILRDDTYPQIGGGIKSRKSVFYEQYMYFNGFNAAVTTGGIQSNHNRTIALMCARNGWPCHLVYHGTRERFEAEKGNALLARMAGATNEFVEAKNIGPSMDAAMERFKNKGLKPMYVTGGGHDLPGGLALVNAVKLLKEQCDKIGYKPNYIVHASGTGSTQAGIAVGLDLVGWSDVHLIGVSIARQKERGTQVIVDFANMLAKHCGLEKDYSGKIDFRTDWLCGGYESFTLEMAQFIAETTRKTGIVFDTTYSGKALFGMSQMMKSGEISGNILFWHTGGIMNVMN